MEPKDWILRFVASLRALLQAPGVRSQLTRIAGPPDDSDVRNVVLVEDVSRLGDISERSLAVLTHGASTDATSYLLDIALREAGSRHASAIVLTDGRAEIPPTAIMASERVGVAVLGAAPESDLAALVLTLQRELSGGAAAALARVHEALAALEQGHATGADPPALLAAATRALGTPLELREGGVEDIAAPIVVEEEIEGTVCAKRIGGHEETAAEIIAHLAAAAVGRARAAARRAEDAPIRSRGELLTEFLLAAPDRGDRLLERMRTADLAVDGWHTAILLEIEQAVDAADDELVAFHVLDRVATLGLEAAMATGGIWHRAQIGSALLFIRMSRKDPGSRGGRELSGAADQIVRRVLSRAPEVMLLCGVGSTHVGAPGLRTTVAEARAAAAAGRAGGHVNAPVAFDEVGLQRTLMEWFASATAREAVDSLLAPIDDLGPEKGQMMLHTLRLYLDSQGSTTKAAEHLHMHRNAVAYRINRIFQLLDVDREDPETRLMLQLACRARLLA
ncbi:MAG: putative transcriptional regulator, PucR family [Conexibacter sp.]|nr:putative transcriptional regulator, PucR family [Conexibacter sp.]